MGNVESDLIVGVAELSSIPENVKRANAKQKGLEKVGWIEAVVVAVKGFRYDE